MQGADPIFFIALGYGVSYRGWQHLTPRCKVTVDGFFLPLSLSLSLIAARMENISDGSEVHESKNQMQEKRVIERT